MQTLEKFIENLPGATSNPRKRIQWIVKELALGVTCSFWDKSIDTHDDGHDAESVIPRDENLKLYFLKRWNITDIRLEWKLLESYGYLDRGGGYFDKLTQSAFELIDETEPYNVFVSYKRSESSALALLCVCRLKAENLVPFVDMALEAGGNWHADLEERIKACDYFIILLGEDTLGSDMTVKEILWASENQRTIIPIWHNQFGRSEGFDLKAKVYECAEKWEDEYVLGKKDRVIEVIQQTHAIIVQDESASGYNSAIVELLNRFGITP